MPKLSVWMIRASMIHMGVGFLFGAVILWQKGLPFAGWVWRLLNPHIELMVAGWTLQLVMGVAFFILPRFANRNNRYGAEYLGWWSFFLLNSGLCLTVLGYWFFLPTVALAGRLLEMVAVMNYVVMIFPRIKPVALDMATKKQYMISNQENS